MDRIITFSYIDGELKIFRSVICRGKEVCCGVVVWYCPWTVVVWVEMGVLVCFFVFFVLAVVLEGVMRSEGKINE